MIGIINPKMIKKSYLKIGIFDITDFLSNILAHKDVNLNSRIIAIIAIIPVPVPNPS
jgi:hypothetical protein